MFIPVMKPRLSLLLVGLLLAAAPLGRAQWSTQTISLKPGWNAVYLQVDASYTNLDTLLPDAQGPISQIWQWNPTFSVQQYSQSPADPYNDGTQWTSWSSARGDTDTLTLLGGNNALLVYNQTTNTFVWSVKGRPRPPNYQWTTTGLNFFGYPTPSAGAPNFSTYYAPVPKVQGKNPMDPQNFGTSVHVFHYPGGALGSSIPNPLEVTSGEAATTAVNRGEAFWVQGPTNYYNLYYGPVQISLQNPAGVNYGNNLGEYSLFLNNLTASNRTITLKLSASDSPPAGQKPIVGTPELLVRGALNSITLDYTYTPLDAGAGTVSFTLTPAGQVGSQLTVVLGLNRVRMTAAPGALYAAVLRLTDTNGLQQVDLPVSAIVSSTAGLWVGNASITGIAQYLKAYPQADTSATNQTAQINAAAAAAGRPANGSVLPGPPWSVAQTNPTLLRVTSIANPSFEANTITTWPGYGSIANWVGGSGLNSAGISPFADNGIIPDKAQVAFIQASPSLSQTLSNFTVGGTYQLHYFENARAPYSGAQNLDSSWPVPPTSIYSVPTYSLPYVFTGWNVRVVTANINDPSVWALGTIAQTEDLLAHPAKQLSAVITNRSVINFTNTGVPGHFTNDALVPGLNGPVNNFAVEATGYLTVPSSGSWSFGVNSDDGFQLVVSGQTNVFDGGRVAADTIATFNLAAGICPVRLVYFNAAGPGEVEVYAAPGAYATFGATTNWALVGDTAHGGLAIVPPVAWAYPSNMVTLSGAILVSNHVVTSVGAYSTYTNAYHEIFSAPFVAAASNLTLAFNKSATAMDTNPVPVYNLVGGSINSLPGGWAVITPYPFSGGWQFNPVTGTWQTLGQTNLTPAILANAPLSGTLIGTPYTWNNAYSLANAFDGNTNTTFSALYPSGEWVGLDFGVGASNRITSVGYTPRSGHADRMAGGIFQGANRPDFSDATTLFTLASAPPDAGTNLISAVSQPLGFRYVRYFGPANGYCDIAELQFYGQPVLANYDAYLTTQNFTNGKYGQMQVSLKHRWDFGAYNGGQLQLSVNGSPFQSLPATATFSSGPPNGTIPPGFYPPYTSALRGQVGWISGTESSTNSPYTTTVLNLGYFNTGDILQLRLHAAFGSVKTQQYMTTPALPYWEVAALSVTNTANPTPDTTLLLDNVSVYQPVPPHYYSALAASVNGQILVAADAGADWRGGLLYVSSDAGQTWAGRGTGNAWSAVACSQDGRVMLAGVYNGPLFLSTDSGSTWQTPVAAPGSQPWWRGMAASSDGTHLAAVAYGGKLYTSADTGLSWSAPAVQAGGGAQNFVGVAMSADGTRLVTAVEGGTLYCSTNAGVNWRSCASAQDWSAVASSADGTNLVATVAEGPIYTSSDAGDTWTAQAVNGAWTAVASSTDGLRLTAAADQLYSSVDAGVTWVTNATDGASHVFGGVASSGDGGLLTAVTGDGASGGSIFDLTRSFASYTLNPDNGLVEDWTGAYLTSGVNTNNGGVASAMPLRLILHNTAAGQVTLLQRVYVGLDIYSNTVVANRQSLLDPSQLASARRISAVHLPFVTNNPVWTAAGNVLPGSVLNFNVFLSYKDQASNPFIHVFHPDHDNLDTAFQHVQPRGVESYDINRNLILSFTSPGTNYGSLTAAAQTAAGYYQETLTVGGLGAAARDFHFNGTFSLQQISTISNLLINIQ